MLVIYVSRTVLISSLWSRAEKAALPIWLLNKLLIYFVLLSSYFLVPPFAHFLFHLCSLELKRNILHITKEGGSQRCAFFCVCEKKGCKRRQLSINMNYLYMYIYIYTYIYIYRLDVNVILTLHCIWWIWLASF